MLTPHHNTTASPISTPFPHHTVFLPKRVQLTNICFAKREKNRSHFPLTTRLTCLAFPRLTSQAVSSPAFQTSSHHLERCPISLHEPFRLARFQTSRSCSPLQASIARRLGHGTDTGLCVCDCKPPPCSIYSGWCSIVAPPVPQKPS